MSVTLTIRSPPARMPAWYPPQDPAAPHVYELSDAAQKLVRRALEHDGAAVARMRFDGSVESCTVRARALSSAMRRADVAPLAAHFTESMRNDLFHFGAFNAVAADCGGYAVVGDLSELPQKGDESDDQESDADGNAFEHWAALRAWAAESYDVEDEGGDIFSFVVDWTDTERTQRVIVRPASIQDEVCAVFVSFVARKEQVDPWALLSRNLDDAFATFGLDDEGRVLLTCSLPVALLTPGRCCALVDVLAASADDAEAEFTDADEF